MLTVSYYVQRVIIMRKKAKSFAVEEQTYTQLSEIFKENYVEVSISYCINKFMKDLLEYLESIKGGLKENVLFTVPLAFIIENVARDTLFKKFDTKQSIEEEIEQYQQIYNVYTKKHPDKVQDYDIENINAELQYTKFAKLLFKAQWQEMKLGRELTDDEFRELGMSIGGKEFVKGIRTKVKPLVQKIEKYDPDLRDVCNRLINTVFKKQSKGE